MGSALNIQQTVPGLNIWGQLSKYNIEFDESALELDISNYDDFIINDSVARSRPKLSVNS
jgi:hypothetical protein